MEQKINTRDNIVVVIERLHKNDEGKFTGDSQIIVLKTEEAEEYINFWVKNTDEQDYEVFKDKILIDSCKDNKDLWKEIEKRSE
jgi:hypothetical protein